MKNAKKFYCVLNVGQLMVGGAQLKMGGAYRFGITYEIVVLINEIN